MPAAARQSAHAAQIGYWSEPARPLMSLVFVLPMLLLYEAGTILLGPEAARNGADVWLRHWLDLLGFSQHLLLPALVCGVLLAWHHTQRQAWQFTWSTYYGMLLESLLFGSLLLLVAEVQGRMLMHIDSSAVSCAAQTATPVPRGLVVYLGAGIYEELLFRLMLLPTLATALQMAGMRWRGSWIAAVLISSVLFAAVHYRVELTVLGYPLVLAHGDAFEWFSFVFRFLAGLAFALLFVYRGFGIAAGSHALYDVLAVVL